VKPRVLIADDHPPTRAGVRAALERDGFVVCAEVSTAQEAVAEALRTVPEICLLDIHMPGSGIAAAATIAEALPRTDVVMLTVSDGDDDLFDALQAGAAGYLLKDTNPARLGPALRGLLNGQALLPRPLVAKLIAEFRDQSARRRLPIFGTRGVQLTRREWQVLEFLRDGLTTREIAARLFVSRSTVRTHIAAILRKMDAPTREAALELLEGR
jgi:two-component system, NarL family, nitrate/nitrite response regulator NarL